MRALLTLILALGGVVACGDDTARPGWEVDYERALRANVSDGWANDPIMCSLQDDMTEGGAVKDSVELVIRRSMLDGTHALNPVLEKHQLPLTLEIMDRAVELAWDHARSRCE